MRAIIVRRLRRVLWGVFLALLVTGGVWKILFQDKEVREGLQKAAPSYELSSQLFTLGNGMKVVVLENPNAPSVLHMVLYDAGGIKDPKGKTGLAHFLEHLMFKGTKNTPDGIFSQKVAAVGGEENAFTTYDYAGYHQTIAPDFLPMVMELESDRMANLTIDDDHAKKERDVVYEERRTRVDNSPAARLREKMRLAFYKGHPYRRPLAGWGEDIASLTAQDARDFYHQYYGPQSAVLILAGKISAKEAMRLAKKHYGHIKKTSSQVDTSAVIGGGALVGASEGGGRKPSSADLEADAGVDSSLVILVDQHVNSPLWARYYSAPSYADVGGSVVPLELASAMISGGEGGLLYEELVLKRRLAVNAGGYYDPLTKGPSSLSLEVEVSVGVSIGQVEMTVNELMTPDWLLPRLTEERLARAKNRFLADVIYAQESPRSLVTVYGQSIMTTNSVAPIEGWKSAVLDVTLEEVRAAVRQLFSRSHYVTGHLLRADGDLAVEVK